MDNITSLDQWRSYIDIAVSILYPLIRSGGAGYGIPYARLPRVKACLTRPGSMISSRHLSFSTAREWCCGFGVFKSKREAPGAISNPQYSKKSQPKPQRMRSSSVSLFTLRHTLRHRLKRTLSLLNLVGASWKICARICWLCTKVCFCWAK